ncbi:MAG: Hsp20/alpha crystallin family protein [Deinococcus sp.]|nr:Hsp20/alpha crystallin family protein [Deinococcus sp.]
MANERLTELDKMRREMEHLFYHLFGSTPARRSERWYPLADVYVTDQAITVRLEVAGADPEELSVTLEGDRLVVRGVRQEGYKERGSYYQTEIEYGEFERVIPLSPQVDADGVTAQYRHGFLDITIPRGRRGSGVKTVKIENP